MDLALEVPNVGNRIPCGTEPIFAAGESNDKNRFLVDKPSNKEYKSGNQADNPCRGQHKKGGNTHKQKKNSCPQLPRRSRVNQYCLRNILYRDNAFFCGRFGGKQPSKEAVASIKGIIAFAVVV